MKKIKYEKPVVQRLGYDNAVMGTTCVTGPNNKANCGGGGNAGVSCGGGSSFAESTVCISGAADVS